MTFLFFSILTNAAIYIIFKWFDIKGIRVFEAIVFNYLTAFTLGLLMVDDLSTSVSTALQWPTWSWAGIGMGTFFISIFYTMAITAQRVGVSVATIASKMSLALVVVLFAITDPNEHIGWLKWTAIAFALAGVVFVSIQKDAKAFEWKMIGFPLIILLGGTLVDFSIAHFSTYPTNESEMDLYSCLPFLTSAVIGFTIIGIKFIKGNYQLRLREVLAGILLGCVNYGSIFFLVRVYNAGIWPKSTVLPLNNLSVVIVCAVFAVLFFKEKLSKLNIIGIAFSILSLILLLNC